MIAAGTVGEDGGNHRAPPSVNSVRVSLQSAAFCFRRALTFLTSVRYLAMTLWKFHSIFLSYPNAAFHLKTRLQPYEPQLDSLLMLFWIFQLLFILSAPGTLGTLVRFSTLAPFNFQLCSMKRL